LSQGQLLEAPSNSAVVPWPRDEGLERRSSGDGERLAGPGIELPRV